MAVHLLVAMLLTVPLPILTPVFPSYVGTWTWKAMVSPGVVATETAEALLLGQPALRVSPRLALA